jgi:putative MFS transporter
MGWLFDAMDVGIIIFVLAALASSWNLTAPEIGLAASSGMAGMFVGAAASGWAADSFGRKRVFQWTLLIFTIFSFLCAASWNLTSLIIFRFFVGLGLGGELPVVSSLMSEFVPGKRRGRFIVLLESFWAYGWLAAAIVAFLVIPTYGWRIAFVIAGVPAFYVWVIRWGLPESPRWYQSKGRQKEAEAVVAGLEEEVSRRIKGPLPEVAPMPPVQEAAAKGSSFKELWSRPYIRRTVMLWILWFCLVFGYYGIFIWLPTLLVKAGFTMIRSFSYVLIITLAQIPGYFSAALLVDKVGRKWIISIFLLLSAVAALFYGRAEVPAQILFWGSIMSFFNLGAWGAVYTYTPELYPTRARASGAGSAAAFGRLGGIIAPTLVGLLLASIGTSGVLAMNAAMLAVAAIAVGVLGIETKGKTLEEISR